MSLNLIIALVFVTFIWYVFKVILFIIIIAIVGLGSFSHVLLLIICNAAIVILPLILGIIVFPNHTRFHFIIAIAILFLHIGFSFLNGNGFHYR